MVKLDDVKINVGAYQLDSKEGEDEVKVGLEIKMIYKDKIVATSELPYAHAVYLMEKLPENDPLKKDMFKALKTLPRNI